MISSCNTTKKVLEKFSFNSHIDASQNVLFQGHFIKHSYETVAIIRLTLLHLLVTAQCHLGSPWTN